VASLVEAIPALLLALEQSGAKIQELSTRRAMLEDVFLALTGRSCAMSRPLRRWSSSFARDSWSSCASGGDVLGLRLPRRHGARPGFAFQNKAPEAIPVGITGADTPALRWALGPSKVLKLQVFPSLADGRAALRTGKIALLVEAGSPLVYWYDATRPDARMARSAVNDAVQQAAGRADPTTVKDALISEKGSRYIDFLLPASSA
jgi:hypothetical protein